MKLLYICSYQFKVEKNICYSSVANGDAFWRKYLDVFENIEVLGEPFKDYSNVNNLTELKDKRVSVNIILPNSRPQDLKNDFEVRRKLHKYIRKAECIIIKPCSRKGIMAINIAKKYKRPYMIEVTGDLKSSLKNERNVLKKIYGPFIHKQILRAISNCKFGLYVTQEYLQSIYPIEGVQCGCTDTVIPYIDNNALDKRLKKIKELNIGKEFKIGLIGTYHSKRKGIDTALLAIAQNDNPCIQLHILGNGIREDQAQWYLLAEKLKIRRQLFFDEPISGIENVFEWIDSVDAIILPSRSEGLPRCIVEALSRACPCIISNVCGMPELVSDEWLHDPEDYLTLSIQIKRIINDKTLMYQCAYENFEHAKKYTYESIRKKRNDFLTQFKVYSEMHMQ